MFKIKQVINEKVFIFLSHHIQSEPLIINRWINRPTVI